MTDHTGRDDQIVTKALCYAIEAIGRLPEEWQEASDQRDMLAILEKRFPDPAARAHHLWRARAHLTGEGFPSDHPSRQIALVSRPRRSRYQVKARKAAHPLG